ncbi:MAG: hypothetical protein U9O87_09935 [Verrucomicrobiota bacterium]|nr:hypothetical protein [Verrucomicrobiota bacterium]
MVFLSGTLGFLFFATQDYYFELQEKTVFTEALILTIIVLFIFVFKLIQIIYSKNRTHDAARLIEIQSKNLHDSLVCATEIVEKKQSPGIIEKALITDVEEKTSDLNFLTASGISKRLIYMFLLTTILAFLAPAVFQLNVTKKIQNHFFTLTDNSTGIEVTPGNIKVAEGTDLQITATIKRGIKEADIQLTSENKQEKFKMEDKEEKSIFTVYNITKPTTYTITTPSLTSHAYKIKTYLFPQIEQIDIKITPPEYTNKKVFSIVSPEILDFPANSKIEITCTTNKKASLKIKYSKDTTANLIRETTKKYNYKMTLKKDEKIKLSGTDYEGYKLSEKTFNLNAIQDFAPSIKIYEPERDSSTIVGDSPETKFGVNDEYGISKVYINWWINEARQKDIICHQSNKKKMPDALELSHFFQLDDAKAGDIITFTVNAEDNMLPKHNATTTEAYFIEVRPENYKRKSKMKGCSSKLDISDLITEQKRIIRSTITYMQTDYKKTEKLAQDIKTSSGALRIATQKKLRELKEKNKIPEGATSGSIIEVLFETAIDFMKAAEQLCISNLITESLPRQQSSLSTLISLEIELKKNAASGEGKSKKSSPDNSKKNQNEQNKDKQQQKTVKKLKKAIKNLQEQIEKQNELNKQSTPPYKANEAIANELKEKQKKIATNTRAIREEIAKMHPEVEKNLEKAEKLMDRNLNALQKADNKRNLYGKVALQHLSKAKKNLKDLLKYAEQNMIKKLQQQMAKLAQQQEKIAEECQKCAEKCSSGKSGKKTGENSSPAKSLASIQKKQKEISKKYAHLEKQIRKVTSKIREKYKNASKMLKQTLQKSQKENLKGKLKKAENALQFNLLNRAQKEQSSAAKTMGKLTDMLSQAVGKMPQMTKHELLQLLSKLREQKHQLKKNMQNKRPENEIAKSIRKDLNKILKEMAGNLTKNESSQIKESLSKTGKGSGTENKIILSILNQLIYTIEKKLLDSELQKRIRSNNTYAPPPEKYRKQVNEYFKQLSTE